MEKEIKIIPSRDMMLYKKGKSAIKVVIYASKNNNLSPEQRTINARHVKMIRRHLAQMKLLMETYNLISLM